MAQNNEPALTVSFSFDPASGLFFGTLENGARFAIEPNNISGKLRANLDLFFGLAPDSRGKLAVRPRPQVFKTDPDAGLIAEAIAAGKLTKVGKGVKLSLEDIGL